MLSRDVSAEITLLLEDYDVGHASFIWSGRIHDYAIWRVRMQLLHFWFYVSIDWVTEWLPTLIISTMIYLIWWFNVGLDVADAAASSLKGCKTEAELSVLQSFNSLCAISVAKLAFKFQDGCMLGLQLDPEIFCIIRILSWAQVRVYDRWNSLSSWAAYPLEFGIMLFFEIPVKWGCWLVRWLVHHMASKELLSLLRIPGSIKSVIVLWVCHPLIHLSNPFA